MGARRRPVDELHAELRTLASRISESHEPAKPAHELQVYQEELAVQNEALRHAQAELEDVRDQSIELYDFAPIGYLTLDQFGVIRRSNLTAAAWLGKSKDALEGMPFQGFLQQDRRTFVDFLRRCRQAEDGRPVEFDTRLRGDDGARDVLLVCRKRCAPGGNGTELLAAVVDTTDQHRLQSAHQDELRHRAMLAGRLISVQEEERNAIARDLHDSIGQEMTALRMKLQQIGQVCEDNARFSLLVAEADALAERIDQSIDFLAAELRPPAIGHDFGAALRQFAEEWARIFRVATTVKVAMGVGDRLDPAPQTHLYRVMQEALHNIHKHAHATEISIVLQDRTASVLLIIEDNGVGPDAILRPPAPHQGIGLLSMRERVALMNGSIEFTKARSGGTRVVVQIPSRPSLSTTHSASRRVWHSASDHADPATPASACRCSYALPPS